MNDAPFDTGLQPERTLLAWRRTCLAISVGGLLFIRFGVAELGALGVLLGLLVLLIAAGAYIDAARRYRQMHAHLTAGRVRPSPAVPATLLAASGAIFALACMAWLLAMAARGTT
ncbi:MAG: DUF202 domain-containing protein [Candidatus Dormibacteraeota bacterium]|nr:DUF202 domain-containing protein [Candidatus Dormibacteraeota bacterium]